MSLVSTMDAIFASTFLLYFKTHAFHWNVIGPNFPKYHEFFNNQYEELHDAVDIIAESIRTLDGFPSSNFSDIIKNSFIDSSFGSMSREPNEMVEILIKDHELLISKINMAIDEATSVKQNGILNILGDRAEAHHKQLWMLKSCSLSKQPTLDTEILNVLRNAGINY